jgi:hypothetical protein
VSGLLGELVAPQPRISVQSFGVKCGAKWYFYH